MISSRDVYKIVGDAKLHRQTALCSSFMQSIPTDLLEHSSDATGAAEVVAGVSGIPALHHLQLVYVCFRVLVPDSASVLQNWPNESLVGSFHDRCWCSAEIPLEEGTSVVGLLGCLVDVLRPCTVLVESHSKVLCCISHLQYMPMDVVLGDDRRWLPCDSQKLTLLEMKTDQPPTLPGLQRIEVCLDVFGVLLRVDLFVNQTIVSKQSDG